MKFLTLLKFTDQGLQGVQHTTERAERFQTQVKRAGVTVTLLWWLTGRFDGLIAFEAPDAQAASAVMLHLSMFGNVSTETLSAFDADEMQAILKTIGGFAVPASKS